MAAPQLLLFLIMTASLWGSGYCQGVQVLAERMEERMALREALNGEPDIVNQISIASEALNNLWTVHFKSVLENSSNNSVSPECVKSAESSSMPELLTLLDATGKLGAGLLSGNVMMHAAFDECFMYDYTGYCGSSVKVSFIPDITLMLGLCVPKHCTSFDVATVINDTEVFTVDENAMLCTDEKTPKYNAGAVIMIAVSSIFGALVLLGTAVDKMMEYVALFSLYKRYGWKVLDNDASIGGTSAPGVFKEAPPYESDTPKINDNSTMSGGSIVSTSNEKSPLLTNPATGRRCSTKPKVKWHEFITAFSLYKTIPTLLSMKQAPDIITSLNGLRVISMMWVILGHSYVLNNAGIDNTILFYDMMSRFSFQAIENALFSVDSFFFLSGVLVAYLTLKQMKKTGRFPFFHYYIHRYLRLTPTYAFVLFFGAFLANHIVSSSYFAVINPLYEACSKYWWTNLLYINNLFPWKLNDQCMAWGWYLANDMQFFVLAPLIIVPLYYLLPLGLAVAGAMLLCAFTVTAALVGVYDFQGSENAPLAYNYKTNVTVAYSDLIYVKPWARIAPYIVGLLLGCVLHKKVRFPFGRLKNIPFYLSIWFASGFLLMAPLYGLYFIWHGHVPSMGENIMYITFSRCAWSVGLALLVFACHNGYGGIINTFLSMKVWTPLSRLTFNAYLVHPIILTIVYGQLEKPIHYTDVTLATFYVAYLVFSYSIAAVLCVCVEFPIGSIEMLLFKLVGLGGRESQRQDTVSKKEVTEGKMTLKEGEV